MAKKKEEKKPRRADGPTGPEWQYTEKRSKAVTIMVTPRQFETFSAAAKPLTVSTWILQAALNALPKETAKEVGTLA